MRKFILVVLVLAGIQYWDELADMFSPSAAVALDGDARVVMYAAQWCGYCAQARDLFRSQGVAFREYDIERSSGARRQFESLGGRGVPLIVIDRQVIRGFDRRAILAALQRR